MCDREGDRHTRWLTSITLIETRSLRIYLHQLQILLFCLSRLLSSLQIMMKNTPPPPSLFSHFSAQLSNFVRVCGLREKTSIRRIVSSGWAEHFPKYVYLPDRKLTQFFLSPKKRKKLMNQGCRFNKSLWLLTRKSIVSTKAK